MYIEVKVFGIEINNQLAKIDYLLRNNKQTIEFLQPQLKKMQGSNLQRIELSINCMKKELEECTKKRKHLEVLRQMSWN